MDTIAFRPWWFIAGRACPAPTRCTVPGLWGRIMCSRYLVFDSITHSPSSFETQSSAYSHKRLLTSESSLASEARETRHCS